MQSWKLKRNVVEFILWEEICITGTTKQLMLLCRKLRCLFWAPQFLMMVPSSSNGAGENLFTTKLVYKEDWYAFDVVKTTGLVYHPSSKIGSGEQVTSSPLQTPCQIVQQYESEPHSYSTLPVKTSPENGQLRRASLQQRLVSVSLFGCQLLSAHAQALFCLPKNWANLFSISTDQGKKSFKKGKIEFGNLIPWRVSNGSFSLPLLQVSAIITSPCQCYYEETNSIMRSFPIWEPK